MVPANDRVTRCLASHPPGPRGPSSPASSVLSRHCDFLPALPPHFVAFAWRYHGNTQLSLPASLRVATLGLGLVTRYPRPGFASAETTGSPKFLGNPYSRLLMFSDPGRPVVPRPLQDDRMAPAELKTKAPTTTVLSRLNTMASGLAAYVSRDGYPPNRARLASRCRSRSPGRDQSPQGSCKRFPTHVMWLSSFSKLLGTTTLNSSCNNALFWGKTSTTTTMTITIYT